MEHRTFYKMDQRIIATVLCASQALFVAPALGGAQVRNAQPAAASIQTSKELHRVTFTTPHGRVNLFLPQDIAPGDTVSGIMAVEVFGRTDAFRQRNADALHTYRMDIGGAQQPVRSAPAVWSVPATIDRGRVGVILREENGTELAAASLRMAAPASARAPRTPTPTAADFALPRSARPGEALRIPGRFDGDCRTTRVFLGGQEVAVLAESPRACVVQTPRDFGGKSRLEVREREVVVVAGDIGKDTGRQNGGGGDLPTGLVRAVAGVVAGFLSILFHLFGGGASSLVSPMP